MFSLGPMEMAIVGIVAVLLFGKKLPEVMRSLGKSYNEFRKGLAEMQSTVNYSDYSSPTYQSGSHSSRAQSFDDYEEPSAPRFDPPPPDSAPPAGEGGVAAEGGTSPIDGPK